MVEAIGPVVQSGGANGENSSGGDNADGGKCM